MRHFIHLYNLRQLGWQIKAGIGLQQGHRRFPVQHIGIPTIAAPGQADMRLVLLLLALGGLAAATTIANKASDALKPGFDPPIDPVGQCCRSNL